MKPLKYKGFLWSWWCIKIPYTHYCTRGKHNSNFFPQNTPTPSGKLPICYVPEKFVFPSVVGSFILLLVLVPGYLQHPSINANRMKPRMLCDALWLLLAFTTCDSFNKFVLYCLNFLAAYASFHSPQDLTIATCAPILWLGKQLSFVKTLFPLLVNYINIYIFYRIQPRGWDVQNIILCWKL